MLPELKKEQKMQFDSLKNCIDTLQRLRDAHYSQLDTSVLNELDEVIAELSKLSVTQQSVVKLGTHSLRTLQVISQVVSLISNINDLMK